MKFGARVKYQVPYLERVIEGSLSKANRILRIISFYVYDLNMVPHQTVYHQWGKGKQRVLRFTKSGNENIEKAHSLHYIWNQSQEGKMKIINAALLEQLHSPDGEKRGEADVATS